jgi:hypothetical protein
MNDRPTAAELIDAVRGYLEKELLPALTDPRLRFQTLVAANVLAVAGRELATEAEYLEEEWGLLDALLGREEKPARTPEPRRAVERRNRQLCERIRAGDFDGPERLRELSQALRRVVVRKLEVANPRYLGSNEPRPSGSASGGVRET